MSEENATRNNSAPSVGAKHTGIEALEKWCRKYYHFKIEHGGGYQPGDGVYIALKAGGRVVCVDEYSLDKDGECTYPTIDELITEAIRLWHADETPKYYVCYWVHRETLYPEFKPSEDMKWEWWHNNQICARFTAKSEEEAIKKIKDAYAEYFEPFPDITVYERERPK